MDWVYDSYGADVLHFAYAFVWPPGKTLYRLSEPPSATERNPPGYYVERMLESMKHMFDVGGKHGAPIKFTVFLHPATKTLPLANWLKESFSALASQTSELQLRYCNPDDHWRYPVLQRSRALLNEPSGETVIMLDSHDPAADQTAAVRALMSAMNRDSKEAGFTFWPTDGTTPPAERPGQPEKDALYQVYAQTTADLPPDRRRALAKIPWFVDCGLAITTAAFRQRLQPHLPDYDRFLAQALRTYSNVWTDFEATSDEALLDLALLRNPEIAPLVRQHASIQGHWLSASPPIPFSLRPPDTNDWAPPDYPPPALSDALPGDRELRVAGQLTTEDGQPERIRATSLRWGTALVVLPVRKKPKPAPNPTAPAPAPATAAAILGPFERVNV